MPRANDRFYDLLEVAPYIDAPGIERAFKRISERLTSPRWANDDMAKSRLAEVQLAYSILGDPVKRPLYDKFGEKILDPGFVPPPSSEDREAERAARHEMAERPDQPPVPRPNQPVAQSASDAPAEAPPRRPRGGNSLGGFPEPMGGPSHPSPVPARDPQPDFRSDGAAIGEGRGTPPPPQPRRHRAPPVDDAAAAEPDPESPPPQPGPPEPILAWVSFRRAALGGKGEFIYNDEIYEMDIPPGSDDGDVIRAGRDGEILLEVRVEHSSDFERDGLDLLTQVNLSQEEAAEGTEVIVPTLDRPVKVRVPPGVATGGKLRVKGKGIPSEDGPGDLIARIIVLPPGQKPSGPPRVQQFKLG